MKRLNILAALWISMYTLFGAAEGGMTSSGSDTHKWGNESAWFLGAEPISYCIEVGPAQKITASQVQADFESGVRTWKKYYFERTSNLHPESHRLNFDYRLEPCQESTRLKIYVGVVNDEVAKARALYENPLAFAYRKTFDLNTGLGTGFIWFSDKPDAQYSSIKWEKGAVFHGMMLHELGHVYGCDHLKNTIMDENMVSNLQTAASDDPNWAQYGKMYMTSIDHHYFLLLSPKTRVSMRGYLYLNDVDARARFIRLTGRSPVGQIHAQVELKGEAVHLSVWDSVRKDVIIIPLNYTNRTSFSLGNRVFYSVRGAKGWSTGSSGETFVSTLRTLTGETLLSQIDINSGEIGWPIRIRFMDGGVMQDTFGSDLWLNTGLPR